MTGNGPIITCSCGELFDCDRRFVGGYVNCPRCGKAVQVPGLRDGWWRLVQFAALVGWAGAVVLAVRLGGPSAGLVVGLCGAALLWLLSRLF